MQQKCKMNSGNSKHGTLLLEWLKEMKRCICTEDYGKAYAFLLLILKVCPNLKYFLEEEFCESWSQWSTKLLSRGKVKEAVSLYTQGSSTFPECEEFHLTMAECYYKMDQKLASHCVYNQVLLLNPRNMVAQESIDYLRRSIIDNWHYEMLNDRERNSKFHEAIHAVISRSALKTKDNIHVVDIGSGTGIMSMYAAQTGKAAVVACEACPVMSELGKEIVTANDFAEDITTLNCMSFNLEVCQSIDKSGFHMPVKASLAISEVFDAGAFGEGVILAIDNAWKRLLLPGSAVIPERIKVRMSCIESCAIHKKHCGRNFVPLSGSTVLLTSNIGVHVERDRPRNRKYVVACPEEPYTSERVAKLKHKILSDYALVNEVDFKDSERVAEFARSDGKTSNHKLKITSDGFLDAVVLCFELVLDGANPNVVLNTQIGSETCWEQAIYPIRWVDVVDKSVRFSRIPVCCNDEVILHLVHHHDKILVKDCTIKSAVTGCLRNYQQLSPFNHVSLKNCFLLIVDEEEVSKSNDTYYIHSYHDSLKAWYDGVRRPDFDNPDSLNMKRLAISKNGDFLHVLDLTSGFSFLCCHLAMHFPEAKFYKVSSDQKSINHVTRLCVEALNLDNVTLESGVKAEENYDAVIADVVEQSGFLSQCTFKNVIKAKSRLKLPKAVFPRKVKMMAMVIESYKLLQRCTIPCTKSTLGLDIGTHLAGIKAKTLSHLDMNKTDYKALTLPTLCAVMDFARMELSDLEESATKVSLKAINFGTAHAVLIWYILEMNENVAFNTMDPDNSWLQCASMNDGNQYVKPRDALRLVVSRRLSYVRVDLELCDGEK